MINCLYNTETNALLGVSESEIDPVVGQSVAVLARGLPDFAREAWNPAMLDFYTKPGTVLTKLQFMKRFTAPEYAAVKSASAVNAEIDFFWQKFLMAEEIVLDDPELLAGLFALEGSGLLAAGRATEILA